MRAPLLLFLALSHLLSANIAGFLEFSDRDFSPNQWTRLNLPIDEAAPRGATLQTTVEPEGGNPQRYMNLAFDIPANRDGQRFTYLAVFLHNTSRYTPSVRGPILSLSYREDAFTRFPTLGPGVGQGRGLALRQNGRVFIQTGEFTQNPTTWKSFTSQIRATNFAEVGRASAYIDATRNPDFSATGGEIELGFWRGHIVATATSGSSGYPYYETTSGTPAVQSSIGIDNWIVSVNFAAAKDDLFEMISSLEVPGTLNSGGRGVMFNDNSVPGARVILDAPPAKGTLTLQPNGTFVYARNPGAAGDDLFTYRLELQTWKSNQASVTIIARPPGLSCTISPQTYRCGAGCAMTRNVMVRRDLNPAPNLQVSVTQTDSLLGKVSAILGPFTTNSIGEFSFRPSTQDSQVSFNIAFPGEQGTGCQAHTILPTATPEPASENDGCPFLALTNPRKQPGGNPTIETFHRFRDQRLNRHPEGRRLTGLYYGAARAAVARFMANPLLAFQSLQAIHKYLPLVEAAVAGQMPKLSEADRTEIADLLGRFRGDRRELNRAIDAATDALYNPVFLLESGIAPPTEVTAGSPALRFARLLGKSSIDSGNAVALDADGNIYLAGNQGASVWIAKHRPSGEVIYETLFRGSGTDWPLAIAVDSRGNAYVVGSTTSRDLPVSAGALQRTYGGGARDGFVLKLDPTGKNILYASYLGGSGDDIVRSLQVASDGSIFVGGMTGSSNFPQVGAQRKTLAGLHDAFLARIDADGRRLLHSTLIGGTQDDAISGIALDANSGSLYLAGSTRSTDFPSRNGFRSTLAGGSDGFLMKLVPDEGGFATAYATLFGGTSDDAATSIALDRAGNPYLAGYTSSGNDFPLLRPAEWRFGNRQNPGLDAFAAKFDGASGALIYSTFLGGNGTDAAGSIAVDAVGNLYVAGYTESGDLAKGKAPQSVSGGGVDGLLAVLAPDGSLVSRGPLGGSGFDLFSGVAVSAAGQLVVTGTSWSEDTEASETLAGSDAYLLSFDLNRSGAGIARATPALRWESHLGIALDSRVSVFAGGIREGVSIELHDAAGKSHALEITDSGPGRLEFVVPAEAAEGIARLRATDSNGVLVASGRTRVGRVTPAITLDGAMLTREDGATEAWSGQLDASSGPVSLTLIATGIRNARALRAIASNGRSVEATVVAIEEHPGLDRVTLGPLTFNEAGEVTLMVDADGVRSNPVTFRIVANSAALLPSAQRRLQNLAGAALR